MKNLRFLLWIIISIFSINIVIQSIERNHLSLLVLKGTLGNAPVLYKANEGFQNTTSPDCQSNWLAGLVSGRIGEMNKMRTSWLIYLDCSQTSITLLRVALPGDTNFADNAIKRYPNDLDALYWAAASHVKDNPDASIEFYTRIITLDKGQGWAWCFLGNLQEMKNLLQPALYSFSECCTNGDPNSLGCYRAGQVMEKLGDPHKAIGYYRLSHWQGALDRANELEKQFQP